MSAIRAEGVRARYGRQEVLHGLDFAVPTGGSLGIVGESGSGKSTLGRLIAGLVRPSAGHILIGGKPAATSRSVQLIFQSPAGALNPRRSCGASVAEALQPRFGLRSTAADVRDWFELAALDPALMERRPAQLSGGQKQRVAIARALAARPRVLVADEITSALDLSVQASILNLLRSLRDRFGFTLIFISHDLPVVRYLCDDIAVMCGGRIVEAGAAEEITRAPADPYTQALFEAVPRLALPSPVQTCEVS
ncbi:ABC transporter ATP-binding protein [Sphingomonas sp.]|uniref:ABC transporter ATP-binding protein n=1 Tax=Sphingomonas sp. TaxID=28214 RepID=UPI002DBFA2F9|nr:ABC transporter ATP-binding protein [Sphingomonas sp.]HEU4969553.1 ABC transporter ATP-binding protein [Sphingomonas sp.]